MRPDYYLPYTQLYTSNPRVCDEVYFCPTKPFDKTITIHRAIVLSKNTFYYKYDL
jgi:hypothetical protein